MITISLRFFGRRQPDRAHECKIEITFANSLFEILQILTYTSKNST